MEVMRRLYEACAKRATEVSVTELVIGLGYTAVATDDDGLGLAYTWSADKACCSFWRGWEDVEGAPASGLLERLGSDDGIERSVALATVNALNHAAALSLPVDDRSSGALVEGLGIGSGSRVAMVGFFPPLAKTLTELGAELRIVDEGRGMGDEATFRGCLSSWADVLIMTATTLLGGTTEDLLAAVGPRVRAGLLGPSTPLIPEAFAHLPVDVLAGMAPVDADEVLRAVRHGAGTPQLSPFSRKVYWRRGVTPGSRVA